MLDLQFNFKFIYKYLIIVRYSNIRNTYAIPLIVKILIYVKYSKIFDIEMSSIFNFFYLFKFFFGKKGYVSNWSTFFDLGKIYYSFNIGFDVINKEVFFIIFFLFNEFLSSIYKLFINFTDFFSNLNLLDLNYFADSKNNLGLFNLDRLLSFEFIIFFLFGQIPRYFLLNIFKLC